jgi:hypothetical protein
MWRKKQKIERNGVSVMASAGDNGANEIMAMKAARKAKEKRNINQWQWHQRRRHQ